jgi:hypothetical protein
LKLELPEKEDSKLWRFLNLPKALALLQTGELYFRRSDLLQDMHEGSVTRYLTKDFYGNLPIGLKHVPETMRRFRKTLRKAVYLNCWYLDDIESEAMWRLYCPDGYGVAIQTRFSTLRNLINSPNIKMGKVHYVDHDIDHHDENTFPADNLLYPFFRKRKSFVHEKEFRLMLFDGIQDGDGNYIEAALNKLPEGRSVKVDLDKCIETLVVSPYAPSWFYETIKHHLTNTVSNLAKRLTPSQLSVEPYF